MTERSEQVAMMGDIYRNAAVNIVWLGDETETTASGFTSAAKLVAEMMARFGPLSSWAHLLTEGTRYAFVDEEPFPEGVNLRALLAVYTKPWFTRLWIWQEAILPRHSICLCGSQELDLGTVLAAAACIGFRRKKMPRGVAQGPGVSAAASIFDFGFHRRAGKSIDLLQMYLTSQRTMCSDHKDRVYGLLGLLDQEDLLAPRYLKVDYAKSLAAVLRDSIKAIVIQHGSLSMLNYVMPRRQDPELEDLPSWVPVFSEKLDLGIDMFELDWEHDAAAGMACHIMPHTDEDVLAVSGFMIDCVAEVSRTFTEDGLARGDQQRELRDVCREMLATSQNPPFAAHTVDEVIAFTLTGHKTGKDISDAAELLTRYKAFSQRASSNGSEETTTDYDRRAAESFSQEMASRCHNRRMYLTRDGSLGLGTWDMQIGDVLAILHGSMWPVLLRPLPDDTHGFVGVSYVKDLMDGEAVRDIGDLNTTICLR